MLPDGSAVGDVRHDVHRRERRGVDVAGPHGRPGIVAASNRHHVVGQLRQPAEK